MREYVRFLVRCARLSFHGDWRYYTWMFVLTVVALLGLAMRVPGEAATAMLRGLYRLDAPSSQRARRFGGAVAMFLVIATLLLALAALLFG